jgi:drug/metabolite transporter (DMT)-like permease
LPKRISHRAWSRCSSARCRSSSVTFYINHWLLQRLTAWMVGLQALIIPVIAVVVGALFAHEAFGGRELIGAALVIAGVWIALRPSTKRLGSSAVVADVDRGF